MGKLIFVNSKGASVEIGNKAPYILKQVKGLDGMDAQVQTKKAPFQYGKSYIDSNINERLISVKLVLLNDSVEEKFKLREQLLRVFNPILGEGTLKYIYGEKEKEIKVAVDQAPKFNDDDVEGPDEQLETMIHLIAADPFLLDTFISGDELSYLMGGIYFGLKLPTTFSYRGKKKRIENEGDISTPILIEFYGPATNPTVTNITTNEFLKVKKELLEDEILTIDTSFDDKKVEIKKVDGTVENAFGYIDLETVFWSLDPGENIISYSSDNDSTKNKVKITFKNRYVGV